MKPRINRLGVVLAELNIQNKELAERLNTTEVTVSAWVQNRSQPSLLKLFEIAIALNIEAKDLIPFVKDVGAIEPRGTNRRSK